MPGVVGERQDAALEARDGQVPPDELVGVVVQVVLDGDAVEPDIGERRPGVDEEADLVVQPVDVQDLALDVRVLLPERRLGPAAHAAPGTAQSRPTADAPAGPPPSWSVHPTSCPWT